MEFSLTMRLLNYFNQAWLKGWNTDLKKVDIHVDDRNDAIKICKNISNLKAMYRWISYHQKSAGGSSTIFHDRNWMWIRSVMIKHVYIEHIEFKSSMYNSEYDYNIYDISYYNTRVSGLVYMYFPHYQELDIQVSPAELDHFHAPATPVVPLWCP